VLGSICGYSVALNGNSRITFDKELWGISGGANAERYQTEPARHLRALVVAGP
jgi:hypothetical protein